LTRNAQFSALCTGAASSGVNGSNIDNSTVVAYLLVIIIFITPGTGGGRAFLGRRGMISGNASVVGVGRRPWLQKVAALSVAISLTIASADTFKYCQQQYEAGYSDAGALVDKVNAGLEIRVVNVI
jgi:hypothetical protein